MIIKLLIGVAVLVGIVLSIMWGVKQRAIATRIVAVVVALGVGIPLLWALYYLSTYDTVSGFVGNITNAFGLPQELTNAFAILMIVPATIIGGMILSFSSQRRTVGMTLLTVGMAVYWVLMWAGTRDHMVTAEGGQLKCYTISAEGVRFFDRQQVDPRTGEMCEWVDPSNLRYIQAIDSKLRSGKPIKQLTFRSKDEVRFFATGTRGAIPLVWYHQASDGKFEFYDVPGVHPVFGTQLQAITQEVAQKWLKTVTWGGAKQAEAKVTSEYSEALSSLEVIGGDQLTAMRILVPAGGQSEKIFGPKGMCLKRFQPPSGWPVEKYLDVHQNEFTFPQKPKPGTMAYLWFVSNETHDVIVHVERRIAGTC